jgi:hypothetical protein
MERDRREHDRRPARRAMIAQRTDRWRIGEPGQRNGRVLSWESFSGQALCRRGETSVAAQALI